MKSKLGTSVPGSAGELGTRLKAVVDRLGGADAVGGLAGMPSAASLRRYFRGDSQPAFVDVVNIATLASVDLRWFADGVVRYGGEPDEAALERAIADVELVLIEERAALNPAAKAKIVMIVYRARQNARQDAEDASIVRNLIRLAAG